MLTINLLDMLYVDHMKYFTYARKSSEAEDRQAASIEDQLKELKILNNRLNLPLVDIYHESKSAKITGRPIFNLMLNQINEGVAQGIIVWHPDRLSRNPEDSAKIVSLMDQGKLLEVVTPSQTFRNNPMDKFMLGFFMMNAKLENDNKSVNVKRGLKAKAEKGWLPSGAKPGYANDKFGEKGNKKLPIDPVKFPLIKQAWTLMLTGAYTVGQILDKLNNEWGYRTLKRKKIGGKPMCRSQIYKMFTDPFYYGEFEYPVGSGKFYKGQHQTMISREEFDRVQILLGRPSRPRPHNRHFSFTGPMTCGECGSAITAEEKWQVICSVCKYKFASKNRNACPKCNTKIAEMKNPILLHYIYYHCTKQKNKKCTQRSIREEILGKQITEILSRIKISERFKHWAIKHLNELNDQEVDTRNAAVKSNQEAYNDIIKRMDNLVALKISPQNSDNGLLNDEEFKKQKTTLLKEKEILSEKIGATDDRIEKWVELSEKTFNFAIHAKYWFDKGDLMTKKEIFQSLGSNIKLNDGVLRLTLEKPFEIFEIAKKEIPEISETIEPEEKTDKSISYEYLWSKNPSMLPRVDSNH